MSLDTNAPKRRSSTETLEDCIAAIKAQGSQSDIVFTKLYLDSARRDAAAADARIAAGQPLSPIDGRIVSIKDLYDVAGETTMSGSKVMAEAPPATRDAPVVERLRRAGAVIVGKTHMTEFAFSAVGLNPHFGNPGNPDDAARVAGGSSTGATIALRKGMCEFSVGSDTGGSIRMPSALCGTVGLKPTQSRISREGMTALCPTFDTAGAIALTVSDCQLLDGVLSGQEAPMPASLSLDGMRIGVPEYYFQNGIEAPVKKAFDDAISTLEAAGAAIVDPGIEQILDAMNEVNARATFPNVESSYVFRQQMSSNPDAIDPFIRSRIERGMSVDAAHYIWMTRQREKLLDQMDEALASVDVLMTPTVPIVAPLITAMSDPEELARVNLLLLRNTWVANFFNLPALSLPCHKRGLPVGMQIIGHRNADHRVFAVGSAVETIGSVRKLCA